MTARRMTPALIAMMALALVAAACGGGGTGGDARFKDLTGNINADGSSTVFPITEAVGEEFGRLARGVKISVGSSGTGGGFKKFCAGETDLSDASRPIKAEEKLICATSGVEFVELKVATDGLSVMVNPQNTFVDCLTTEELGKIWQPNSPVKDWSQVRAGFPSRPLTLYGPGTDSGTFDYFTAEINGEEGASRTDYTASENDNVLVTGVGGDANALGYFGYAYYVQNKDKLKTLGVDPGTGCVKPDEKTINDGSYKPLSRPLYVYVSKKAIDRPEVVAFVDYYLETVNDLVADVGYVALHTSDFKASEQAWTAFKA
jgi:phosphate transport system substrate-binding protein